MPQCVQNGEPQRAVDGAIALPTAPGLGIDLDEEVLLSRPYEPLPIYARFDADGAVADI